MRFVIGWGSVASVEKQKKEIDERLERWRTLRQEDGTGNQNATCTYHIYRYY